MQSVFPAFFQDEDNYRWPSGVKGQAACSGGGQLVRGSTAPGSGDLGKLLDPSKFWFHYLKNRLIAHNARRKGLLRE